MGDDASLQALLEQARRAHEGGRLDEAADAYRRLLALNPGHPGLLNNLGQVLAAARRYEEALEPLRAALRARPTALHVRLALSNALDFADRPAEAVAVCDAGLALEPGQADLRLNRGVALRFAGRPEEAAAELRSLFEADRANADAEYNLALAELLLGRFESGWGHYEARWRGTGSQPPLPHASIASWTPGEPLDGLRVAVLAEQGLGDTLAFLRFVPRLARRCRVALQVQAPLVTLARRSLPGIEVGALGAALDGAFDRRIALLSLPGALGLIDAAALWGDGEPYLAADPARVKAWGERLGAGPAVCFVWRGSPHYRLNRNRSIALDALQPWLAALGRAGVQAWAIQKELAPAEREFLGRHAHVRVLDESQRDIDDTAAMMKLAARVVSIDTMVLHLAGALGVPATGLLHFGAEWRWARASGMSALYRDTRLRRQPSPGAWAPVLEELIANEAATRP